MIITERNMQEIYDELEQYQDILNSLTNISDNITALEQRAYELAEIYARTGKLLTDAKYLFNAHSFAQLIKAIDEHYKYLSATNQNAIAKTICKEEQYLIDWCERINKTAIHEVELIRTSISLHKEEIKLSLYTQQGR